MLKDNHKQVAVIGFGYVGLNIGVMLAAKGAKVTGIDTNEQIVSSINEGICHINETGISELLTEQVNKGNLRATTDIKEAAQASAIIIAVSTPLGDDYEPDMYNLSEVCHSLAPVLKKGQLVIVKSTVPPGTTTNIVASILSKNSSLQPGKDFSLACCPERLAEGRIMKDIKTLPVIVGGLNYEDTIAISSFWNNYGWETIEVAGPEEAEMSKLVDNFWIDTNIALANEVAILCESLGIDVLEVINAANTLPKGMNYVNVLFPGPGVGGSCLVKDPWFVHYLGLKKGLNLKLPATARTINDNMPHHVTKITKDALASCGKRIQDSRIAVLGLAFKHKTGDMRFSPSIPLIKELQEHGGSVLSCDPWVNSDKAKALLDSPVYKDPREIIGKADAVIIMVGHPEFLLSPEEWLKHVGSGTPIVDCRYALNQSSMIKQGLLYFSIGRGRRQASEWEVKLCKEF